MLLAIAEEFRVLVHAGLHHHYDVYMGGYLLVSYIELLEYSSNRGND